MQLNEEKKRVAIVKTNEVYENSTHVKSYFKIRWKLWEKILLLEPLDHGTPHNQYKYLTKNSKLIKTITQFG